MTLIIRTTGVEDYLDGGDAHVKALILGAPSAGKTRSASFWPKPIFADCEKGRMSIADRAVPYAEITSTADMDALFARLRLECRKPVADREFQTLVIDTVDAYQRIVIQERLDSEKKEALSGWGDWGYLDGKMTQFVEKLHQLSMNIVVNVHVKDLSTGDDDSKVTVTGVKLKGDFKDQIAAEFDLVGFMGTYWEAEDGVRVQKRAIQWHPDPNKPILKDRSGQLPKFTPVTFTDDDYANLFGTLIGHLDALPASTQVEELQTDPAITVKPVPPQAGGPVPGAPVAPPTAAKKTAAKPSSQAAKNAVTPTAVASVPAAPKPTVVPVAPKPEVPAQREPEAESGGAESAPEPEPAAVPEAEAAPAAEAAEPVAEAAAEEPLSPEAVADALGGEVISDTAATDATTTDATDEAAPVEVAEVDQQTTPESIAAPKCGTSSNAGEEGQPGAVPGCGADVDVDADMTQIAMFKTKTYLCEADYAAWRAATKK